MTLPVHYIDLPQPPIGNKGFCMQEIGIYVLERGHCTWRGMANTRIGNGSLSVYDTLPNEDGRIPSDAKLLFNSCPAILGMYMFDIGCHHGLTLVLHSSGGPNNLSPCTTMTWMAERKTQRKIENVG
jgi:hypothetical protein